MPFSPIRYELTPAVGGIGGPVSGFDKVQSNFIAKGLLDQVNAKKAFESKVMLNALAQTGETQRVAMLGDIKKDLLEQTIEANQDTAKSTFKRNALISLLGSGTKGEDPLSMQLGMAGINNKLDSARRVRMADTTGQLIKAIESLPGISLSSSSSGQVLAPTKLTTTNVPLADAPTVSTTPEMAAEALKTYLEYNEGK